MERISDPSSMELRDVSGLRPSRSEAATKSKFRLGKKKVHNISKGMIRRVEGGGVGLVNPMGWYDTERADTPSPSPGQPSESTRVNTDDEAIMDSDEDTEDEDGEEQNATPSRSRVTDSPEDMRDSPGPPTGQSFTEEPAEDAKPREYPVPRSNIPTIVMHQYGRGDEDAEISSKVKVPYAGRNLTDGTYRISFH